MKSDPEFRLPSWCLDLSSTDWLRNLLKLRDFPLREPNIGGCNRIPRSTVIYDPEKCYLSIEGTLIGTIRRPVVMTCGRGAKQLLDIRMTDGFKPVGADVIKSAARKLHSDIFRSSTAAWKALQLRLGDEAAI